MLICTSVCSKFFIFGCLCAKYFQEYIFHVKNCLVFIQCRCRRIGMGETNIISSSWFEIAFCISYFDLLFRVLLVVSEIGGKGMKQKNLK
jgi:hypothetical protein